jgi:hypothetical protein
MKWSHTIAQGFSPGLFSPGFTPGLCGPQDRPESTSNLAVAGCNSDRAQYSSTPSPRSPEFEDEDEAPPEQFAVVLAHLHRIGVSGVFKTDDW